MSLSAFPDNASLDAVVVTYQSEDDISACLSSLHAAARGLSLRVLVVDNASTDATLEKLQTTVREGEIACRLIKNRCNVGFTRAVNQAAAFVKAEYVLFLNPDVVLEHDTLKKLFAVLQQRPAIGVIAPQLRNPDGSVQPSCRRLPRRRDVLYAALGLSTLFPRSAEFNGWKMGDFDHRRERVVAQPQGAFLLCRTRVLEDVGLWDEGFPMFFSDVDWCARVAAKGYAILFAPEARAVHGKGNSVNRRRPEMIITSHRSFIRYFWKYGRGIVWIIPNLTVSMLLLVSGAVRYVLARMGVDV